MKKTILVLTALFLSSTIHAELDLQFTQVSTNPAVVDIQNAGDGSNRLFLIEQTGRIMILKDGEELETPFMDIRERVQAGGERGLLSIAFAPDYASSGYFYVYYTPKDGTTTLSRFKVSGNPDVADPGSEAKLLSIPQPQQNHNGGRLLFAPDGYLYLSTGDGGGGGDPAQRALDGSLFLGKILRLDVNPANGAYSIPPDNPFVGNPDFLDEIWAYGLRNPWKMSVDPVTGDIYTADVGQETAEEVNFQPADSPGGENYGWNYMEGSLCFSDPNCENIPGLTLPAGEYFHGDGCSISGGEVYRGNSYPAMHGMYLFGDYCSGKVWTLHREGETWQTIERITTTYAVTTFGRGEDHSVYLGADGDGVFLVSDGDPVPESDFLINAGLNDAWFNPATAGQGFFITVFPDIKKMFVAWFTFDTERPPEDVTAILGDPGARWITAFGDYSGNTATLNVEQTSGGIFNTSPPVPDQNPGGTITVEFSGCNAALITFSLNPPEPPLEGTIAIERIALDNVVICEAL